MHRHIHTDTHQQMCMHISTYMHHLMAMELKKRFVKRERFSRKIWKNWHSKSHTETWSKILQMTHNGPKWWLILSESTLQPLGLGGDLIWWPFNYSSNCQFNLTHASLASELIPKTQTTAIQPVTYHQSHKALWFSQPIVTKDINHCNSTSPIPETQNIWVFKAEWRQQDETEKETKKHWMVTFWQKKQCHAILPSFVFLIPQTDKLKSHWGQKKNWESIFIMSEPAGESIVAAFTQNSTLNHWVTAPVIIRVTSHTSLPLDSKTCLSFYGSMCPTLVVTSVSVFLAPSLRQFRSKPPTSESSERGLM